LKLIVPCSGLSETQISEFLIDYFGKIVLCRSNFVALFNLIRIFEPQLLPRFAIELPIDYVIQLLPSAKTTFEITNLLNGRSLNFICSRSERELLLKWSHLMIFPWLVHRDVQERYYCEDFISELFPAIGNLSGYVKAEKMLSGATITPFRFSNLSKLNQSEFSEATHFLKTSLQFLNESLHLAGSGCLASLFRILQLFKVTLQDLEIGDFGKLLFLSDVDSIDPNFDFIELLRLCATSIARDQLISFFFENVERCISFLKPNRKDSYARFLHVFDAFQSDEIAELLFGRLEFIHCLKIPDLFSIQYILNCGCHRSVFLRLLWSDPTFVFSSKSLSSFLESQQYEFTAVEAHHVIISYLSHHPETDHIPFVHLLLGFHGFEYHDSIKSNIDTIISATFSIEDYFSLIVDCASLSNQFACDFTENALPALTDFSSIGVTRALQIAFLIEDPEERGERVLDFVLLLGDHFSTMNGQQLDPVIQIFYDAFGSESFESTQKWSGLLFAELMELNGIECESMRKFLISYSQAVEDAFDGHIDNFGSGLIKGVDLERIVAFLSIFFEALPGRKTDFLAQFPIPDEVIAAWPENLEAELSLFLPFANE
jgi:hypothetical protein